MSYRLVFVAGIVPKMTTISRVIDSKDKDDNFDHHEVKKHNVDKDEYDDNIKNQNDNTRCRSIDGSPNK